MQMRPSRSTLFPYTTLFRSHSAVRAGTARLLRDAPESAQIQVWFAGATHTCIRSEEHTSELQSLTNLVCRLLLEKKNSQRAHKTRHRRRQHNTPRADARKWR